MTVRNKIIEINKGRSVYVYWTYPVTNDAFCLASFACYLSYVSCNSFFFCILLNLHKNYEFYSVVCSFKCIQFDYYFQLEDTLWATLTDAHIKTPMGITAENLAEKYKLSRQMCDEFALRSQTRWHEGKWSCLCPGTAWFPFSVMLVTILSVKYS